MRRLKFLCRPLAKQARRERNTFRTLMLQELSRRSGTPNPYGVPDAWVNWVHSESKPAVWLLRLQWWHAMDERGYEGNIAYADYEFPLGWPGPVTRSAAVELANNALMLWRMNNPC